MKNEAEKTKYNEKKIRWPDRLTKLPQHYEKKIAETFQTIDKITNKFQNCKKISI